MTETLWNVLANPADTQLHIDELQKLIEQYPQSNLLHTLAARSGKDYLVKNAAVYYSGESLYNLVNGTEPLPTISAHQLVDLDAVVFNTAPLPELVNENTFENYEPSQKDLAQAEINKRELSSETYRASFEETPEPEVTLIPEPVINAAPQAEEPVVAYHQPDEQPQENQFVAPEPVLDNWQPTPANINPPAEPLYYTNNYKAEEPEVVPTPADDPAQADHQEPEPVEDEVYDEIVSIEDIHIAPVVTVDEPVTPIVTEEPYYTNYTEQRNDEVAEVAPQRPEFNLETQITESIYATDYFGFKDALVDEPVETFVQAPQIAESETPHVDDNQTMARYHDENLPYSFLWWLDKTRREHANMYQPYAKPSALPNIGELTDDKEHLDLNLPDPKHKKEEIIERFIQAEPQIKPPTGDKLDNENKARNSAEDSDELVTETLARIYTDQMLYHKAIATYKKLMLRYPEKSSYFAGQVEKLENKTN